MNELATDGVPGLDLAAFRRWYDDQRPGDVTGELRGRVIAGGKSNLTYEITDGSSWWVVRRPPLGHVQATAHDMGREHTVMTALADTDVPVPRTFAHCPDDSVLGAPFYVMENVEGTPYRSSDQLAAVGKEHTRQLADAMVDVLASLHAVVPAEVGLAEFGRPAGFLERQVRRWGKQLEGSRNRDLPDADRLLARLSAAVPADDDRTAGIVHGDYRLDNVLVDGDDRITAVLDWEMSTLGDPLTDIALMVAYAERSTLDLSFVSNVSEAAGYPATDEIVVRYAERSGRDVSALNWYIGFAFFKLAVILEGIYYRFSHGQTVGEGFDKVGSGVAPLVAHGLATLKED